MDFQKRYGPGPGDSRRSGDRGQGPRVSAESPRMGAPHRRVKRVPSPLFFVWHPAVPPAARACCASVIDGRSEAIVRRSHGGPSTSSLTFSYLPRALTPPLRSPTTTMIIPVSEEKPPVKSSHRDDEEPTFGPTELPTPDQVRHKIAPDPSHPIKTSYHLLTNPCRNLPHIVSNLKAHLRLHPHPQSLRRLSTCLQSSPRRTMSI